MGILRNDAFYARCPPNTLFYSAIQRRVRAKLLASESGYWKFLPPSEVPDSQGTTRARSSADFSAPYDSRVSTIKVIFRPEVYAVKKISFQAWLEVDGNDVYLKPWSNGLSIVDGFMLIASH